MANTFFDRYLEAEILTADPVKLVWLLYRGAIDAVRSARECLAQGDIRGRARHINRAWGILRELGATLDHTRGGEVSPKLAGLYAYMQGRLIDANAKQTPEPLEEVIRLLTTLAEGWEMLSQAADPKREISAPASRGSYGEEPDSGERRVALTVG